MTRLASLLVVDIPPRSRAISHPDADRCRQLCRGTIINVDVVAEVVREDAAKQFALLEGHREELPASRQFYHFLQA
jgi:hypothetical protein